MLTCHAKKFEMKVLFWPANILKSIVGFVNRFGGYFVVRVPKNISYKALQVKLIQTMMSFTTGTEAPADVDVSFVKTCCKSLNSAFKVFACVNWHSRCTCAEDGDAVPVACYGCGTRR
jgi:hypothetical protein